MNAAPLVLALAACGSAPMMLAHDAATDATADSHAGCASGRATVDQADDASGYQIHVMYVVPSDGADEQLDTNGAIARSIASIDGWFAAQSGGLHLRLDRCGGNLDITFARLTQTDAQIDATDAYVRDTVEADLANAGFAAPNKIYAVYYGGKSHYACGGGAWPPALVGRVAAEYLKGVVPNAPACDTNPVGASATVPGYFEFAIYHEVLHTLGLVATCAPNHTLNGHTGDSPTDLMYAGAQPWTPSVLDVNHDDYFGAPPAGCPNLAHSAFIDPLPADPILPPGW